MTPDFIKPGDPPSPSNSKLWRPANRVVADFMYMTFTIQQRAADQELILEDVENHAAVYRAIDRGNGEAAAEAMLTVVLDGKSSLVQALSDEADRRRASGTTGSYCRPYNIPPTRGEGARGTACPPLCQ